jgi:hypothetical protein
MTVIECISTLLGMTRQPDSRSSTGAPLRTGRREERFLASHGARHYIFLTHPGEVHAGVTIRFVRRV